MTIIEVQKIHEPFKMQNGGHIYSVDAIVDYKGKQGPCRVRAFTERINLSPGQEHDDAQIKVERKEYKGTAYSQLTIYAPKKDGYNRNGRVQHTYTIDEFDALWKHAQTIAKSDAQLDTYFRCATVSGIKVAAKQKAEGDWEDVEKALTSEANVLF